MSYYYSQDGEDIILKTFYEGKIKNCRFYVDIGAHHPVRFSITKLFYEEGWNGINIDATPNSMNAFNELRKNDINIECGISDTEGELDYYLFEEPALNSFDKELSEWRIKDGCALKEIRKIKVLPINTILDKHIKKDQKIDFITIDIEGYELRIIKSLNFNKYAPEYLLIEDLNYVNRDFMEYYKSPLYLFLKEKGYMVVAKTFRTVIFKKL